MFQNSYVTAIKNKKRINNIKHKMMMNNNNKISKNIKKNDLK